MKVETTNGSYLNYTIFEDRIDMIKSYKKGDGTNLLNQIKDIAFNLKMPIELYSEPQDETISKEQLNRFYEKNGFEYHADDIDYSYFTFK